MDLKFENVSKVQGLLSVSIEKENVIQYTRKKLNPQITLFQMHIDDNAFRLQPEIIWYG